MIGDGHVDDSELLQRSNVCGFSPIFFQLDQKGFQQLLKTIVHEIRANGHPATIEAAA